ncbi:MAG TPA: glycosyltransferase family 4 protein, partial [Alphaproteobacteria bacterium]|nr:glycosyltransferase family 4 protein [Alphaproteobacteria bacterium]
MNVLLASPWPLDFRGGVTVVVRMLGRGLARSGDQVAYLVPTHGRGIQRSEDAGLPVFYVPMRLASVPAHPLRGRISFLLHFPLTCFRLAEILRRQKIDVVNAHYFTAHWIYFLFLRLFLRFRLVISVHGTDVQGSEGQKNIQRMERWQRRIDKL